MKNFTVEDGLNIQKRDLLNWKTKLSTECYEGLKSFLEKENNKTMVSGLDVVRGQSLAEFVMNWTPNRYC